YKAQWNNKNIVFKSLNNSQDIKKDFLQEIANHKLFSSSSRIVNCHGISQEPQTKNYLMVMDYIKDGDLRKFLQKNQLDFKAISKEENSEFSQQLQAAEEYNKNLPDGLKFPKYQIHSGASYH
ncbi:2136_t:CDS:2, partial [Entrophospora sp. SA101]